MKVKKENLVFNHHIKKDEKDDRKFYGVGYSGTVIEGHPFWGNLAFDLATMKSEPRIPILNEHRSDERVGFAELRFTDKVEVFGTFLESTEIGREVYESVKEGYPMQESVYIEPEEIVQVFKGQSMKVNGHELVGPGHVFMGGTIREVSMVSLGADSKTSTTAFANEAEVDVECKKFQDTTEKETKMTKKTEKLTPVQEMEKIFADQGAEEAFKFACSCQDKKNKDQDKEDLKHALEQIESLQEELDGYKEREAEAKKHARKQDLTKMFGAEYPVVLEGMNDEQFEALKSTHFAKVEQEDKKAKELTKEQVLFAEKKEVSANARQLSELSMKIMKEKRAAGQVISLADARQEARIQLGE